MDRCESGDEQGKEGRVVCLKGLSKRVTVDEGNVFGAPGAPVGETDKCKRARTG
jgi:hypothetical protein